MFICENNNSKLVGLKHLSRLILTNLIENKTGNLKIDTADEREIPYLGRKNK